jgi:hypothetical protein
MTTKIHYLPMSHQLLFKALVESAMRGKVSKPYAYIEFIDENSVSYTLTSCTKFSFTVSDGEIVSGFSATLELASTINPRMADYLDLLTGDIRKRVNIYYGVKSGGSINYVRVFHGIPIEAPETYEFGSNNYITIKGKSLGYLLQMLDISDVTTFDYTKIVYTTSAGTLAIGDLMRQENTGAEGTIMTTLPSSNYIVLRNVSGTFNTTDTVNKIDLTTDNPESGYWIDGTLTITTGEDDIHGNSKDLVKMVCDLAGVECSLSYTDTVYFPKSRFGYGTGAAAVDAIKSLLGNDVVMYMDANGVLVMKDTTWYTSAEFNYDADDLIKLDRMSKVRNIYTTARVTGYHTTQFTYASQTGTVAVGDYVEQDTSGANGIVIENNVTSKYLVVSAVVGEFTTLEEVRVYVPGSATYQNSNYVTSPTNIANTTISAEMDADPSMIARYGQNATSMSSGLIDTQDKADALVYDMIKHGRRHINIIKATVMFNPYLEIGTYVTVADVSLANISQNNLRPTKISQTFTSHSEAVSKIEGFLGESSSSSSKSSSSSSRSSSSSSSSSSAGA